MALRGSDVVFRISPNGAIKEIIDASGDSNGNTLNGTAGIVVDGTGNAINNIAGWIIQGLK